MVVQALPDMNRSTEEQEVEIEELEREMERLRWVIRGIAEAAKAACEDGGK